MVSSIFKEKNLKLLLVSLGIFCGSLVFINLPIYKEEIKLADSTVAALVYADSNTFEDVEAEVVFTDVQKMSEYALMDTLSVDNSILEKNISEMGNLYVDVMSEVGNEYIKEVEARRAEEQRRLEEEKRKQEEAEKIRLSNAIEVKGSAILSYNPFVKSMISVDEYNKILSGTGLEGCGQSFYNMEQTYNVNGLFAVAVAFHESGYGKYKANTNNFYGMRGNNGWMSFSSPDANIQYFGQLMNKSLYKGKSIDGIGAVYCPGTSSSWASAVRSMMYNSFAKI